MPNEGDWNKIPLSPRKLKPTTKVVGFLFSRALKIYFQKQLKTKNQTSAACFWVLTIAQDPPSGSTKLILIVHFKKAQENKKPNKRSLFLGFNNRTGSPFGINEVNPYRSLQKGARKQKTKQAELVYGF